MKTKLTLRNRQQQRIIFTRKLIIAGSSVLGVAAAIVVVLNTANTHTSFARGNNAANNNSAVINTAVQAKESKSAGTIIPVQNVAVNARKSAAPFATRAAGASANIIKTAAAKAAFSDAAATAKEDAAAKMRQFTIAYNAQEKDFLTKVKSRDLVLAQGDDADANNEVLNNTDAPAEGVDRKFVVTYVPESVTAELLNFEAAHSGHKIVLKWSTGIEKNNDYFTIERSSDGANYTEIGKTEGTGNTLEKSDYKFTDKHPLDGKNYYRLKHTDKNGNAEYFPENVVEP